MFNLKHICLKKLLPSIFCDLFCERKTVKNSKKSSKSDKILDKMTTEELIKKLQEENERILAEQKLFNFEFWVSVTGLLVIFAIIIWLKY